MNNLDPAGLDRLHDIIVPSPVPFWPPAPGWYLLAAFVAFLLVWLIVRQVKSYGNLPPAAGSILLLPSTKGRRYSARRTDGYTVYDAAMESLSGHGVSLHKIA